MLPFFAFPADNPNRDYPQWRSMGENDNRILIPSPETVFLTLDPNVTTAVWTDGQGCQYNAAIRKRTNLFPLIRG
jgi:hypothetical protein